MAKAKKEKHTREPLLYVVKRDNMSAKRALLVRAVAILLAVVVCGVVTKLLTGDDPLSIFATIFKGAFGTGRTLVTVHDIAILLCVSLAVTPAFRMRFWNTGAEGQVLIGCLATAVCMLTLGGKIPDGLLIVLMTLAAILAGVIWGVIPAFFKANWGTNETLFTLMMNYVAIQLIEYFLKVADKSGSNVVGPDLLTHGWFPNLFNTPYVLNILIVALLTVGMHIYLKYSKHGYEISVVGESVRTAQYSGINVKKVIIRTMLVSGLLCGLAGYLIGAGLDQSITTESVGGQGFTAIMVSWLAKFNPLVMLITSGLISMLNSGASQISQDFNVSGAFPDVIVGIILFFIIGSEFFINYQIIFRRKDQKEGVK